MNGLTILISFFKQNIKPCRSYQSVKFFEKRSIMDWKAPKSHEILFQVEIPSFFLFQDLFNLSGGFFRQHTPRVSTFLLITVRCIITKL